MSSIGICGSARLLHEVRALLRARGIRACAVPCAAGKRYDVVLSDGRMPDGVRAGLLAAAEGAGLCEAEVVCTCGLDGRCTLTPASLLGDLAALRRELPVPGGRLVLPQELRMPSASVPAHRLLLAALLLVFEGAG